MKYEPVHNARLTEPPQDPEELARRVHLRLGMFLVVAITGALLIFGQFCRGPRDVSPPRPVEPPSSPRG